MSEPRKRGTTPLRGRPLDEDGAIEFTVGHDAASQRIEVLEAALRRLIGAVEAFAVAERGGPPVNWNAIDDSQDAARAALGDQP